MQIDKYDENYAATGQIKLEDVIYFAKTGFRSVVCIRPDHEVGEPRYAQVEAMAEKVGLKAAYVPYHGELTPETLSLFKEEFAKLPKPVLGYCASGNRAGTLYRTFKAS